MERCPPELHAVIFDLACRDDGATARALSATSTYTRAVAAPFAFRVLSISGIKQLRGVLAQLSSASLRDKGKNPSTQPIQHLFVCDREPTYASADNLALSRAKYEEERERLFRTLDDEAEQFSRLLPALLTHAAPTLHSLTCLAYSPYHAAHVIQHILRTPFPELRELTLRGSAWEVHPPDEFGPRGGATAAGAQPKPGSAGLFPKLERVHLAATRVFTRILRQITASARLVSVEGCNDNDPSNDVSDDATLGPHDGAVAEDGVSAEPSPSPAPIPSSPITHIRLSGLAKDVRLAARLHAELYTLGLAPRRLPNLTRRLARHPEIVCAEHADWTPVLPQGAALRQVVLQPHRLPPLTDCACCSGYFLTEELAHVLREIGKAQPQLTLPSADVAAPHAKADSASYGFVPASKEGDIYAYADARADWIDRIAGGQGCWDVARGTDDDEGEHQWGDEDYSGF
jgi:hypothetical protein